MKRLIFLIPISLLFIGMNFTTSEEERDQNEIAMVEKFFATVDFSYTPISANTCGDCDGSCDPGTTTCRGVSMDGSFNGSQSLPSGWWVQWTTPNGWCQITQGTTLDPTIYFDTCEETSDGGGYQHPTVTLAAYSSSGGYATRTKTVTYIVY